MRRLVVVRGSKMRRGTDQAFGACLRATPAIRPSGRTSWRNPIARCALGPFCDRCVQAAHPQQDPVLAFARSDDVRSALRAEIARFAGRGFEAAQQVFALDPAKAVARHVGDGGEGRSVRLAAGLAMAVHDGARGRVDFVGNSSAEATSVQHQVLRIRRVGKAQRAHHFVSLAERWWARCALPTLQGPKNKNGAIAGWRRFESPKARSYFRSLIAT